MFGYYISSVIDYNSRVAFGCYVLLSHSIFLIYLHILFCKFIGKSTLACALSHCLHLRGKLSYVLDGDNVRHGLNSDLSFKAEDRAENIRRIGGSLLVYDI